MEELNGIVIGKGDELSGEVTGLLDPIFPNFPTEVVDLSVNGPKNALDEWMNLVRIHKHATKDSTASLLADESMNIIWRRELFAALAMRKSMGLAERYFVARILTGGSYCEVSNGTVIIGDMEFDLSLQLTNMNLVRYGCEVVDQIARQFQVPIIVGHKEKISAGLKRLLAVQAEKFESLDSNWKKQLTDFACADQVAGSMKDTILIVNNEVGDIESDIINQLLGFCLTSTVYCKAGIVVEEQATGTDSVNFQRLKDAGYNGDNIELFIKEPRKVIISHNPLDQILGRLRSHERANADNPEAMVFLDKVRKITLSRCKSYETDGLFQVINHIVADVENLAA